MRRPAELVRVVDGDTLVMRVDLGFGTWRQITVRVLGLDTPETRRIRRKGKQVSEEEVVRGKAAKRYAVALLRQGHRLEIASDGGKDAHGRWLATIYFRYIEDETDEQATLHSFADVMRRAGHVR